jgi:uncharacterized protein
MSARESALIAYLDGHEALAVAVSGGVDSMVLAYLAHRFSTAAVTAVHAVSPAVPEAATARVRRHADRHGWTLALIDAGEQDDPSYRANPLNRCYFCKINLYGRIRRVTETQIVSGTNMDDLGDFRPGLEAASEHGVVHPYVEVGIGKAEIYLLAAAHGLDDLAVLPAQPCLASRIETGIAVNATRLRFIERVESELASLLPDASALRCRITASGIRVECAPFPDRERQLLAESRAARLCAEAGLVFRGVRPYRRGSAFLTETL